MLVVQAVAPVVVVMVEALSVAIPWSPLLTELCPAPVSTISTGGVQVVAELASSPGCCKSGVGVDVVDVVVVVIVAAVDIAVVAVPGVDGNVCACADPAEEGCGTSSVGAGAGDAEVEGPGSGCGLS